MAVQLTHCVINAGVTGQDWFEDMHPADRPLCAFYAQVEDNDVLMAFGRTLGEAISNLGQKMQQS